MRFATDSLWPALREAPRNLVDAVRSATGKQIVVAAAVALAVGVLVGVATVLIPNGVFGRDIAPVAWNYPVLIVTSLLSGLLAATYVRSGDDPNPVDEQPLTPESRMGMLGVVVTWFAVGCPVCNKLAILALGYSGALSWFAPFQPVLAVLGIALLWIALAIRLAGTQRCAVSLPTS